MQGKSSQNGSAHVCPSWILYHPRIRHIWTWSLTKTLTQELTLWYNFTLIFCLSTMLPIIGIALGIIITTFWTTAVSLTTPQLQLCRCWHSALCDCFLSTPEGKEQVKNSLAHVCASRILYQLHILHIWTWSLHSGPFDPKSNTVSMAWLQESHPQTTCKPIGTHLTIMTQKWKSACCLIQLISLSILYIWPECHSVKAQ